MGRAILPGRLKKELEEVKKYLLNEDNEIADSHLDWAKKIKAEHQITIENVDSILQQALVEVFDQVLECAGVFKNNKDGEAGWQKFTKALVSEVDK